MSDKSIGGCLLILAGLLAVMVTATLLDGWVISVLWAWFMVPIFDLPTLTLVQAIGVGVVVSTFTARTTIYKNQEVSSATWIAVFTVPLFSLLMGWVVHLFM